MDNFKKLRMTALNCLPKQREILYNVAQIENLHNTLGSWFWGRRCFRFS